MSKEKNTNRVGMAAWLTFRPFLIKPKRLNDDLCNPPDINRTGTIPVFVFRAGFTREKYGVDAPKVSGNDVWERIHRVQINTMEQLVIFIPGMLIFSHYVSQTWVVIPGVIFIVGRQIFSHLYIKDPKTRTPGVIMTIFTNVALVMVV
jgi:glutathione S-transferase